MMHVLVQFIQSVAFVIKKNRSLLPILDIPLQKLDS